MISRLLTACVLVAALQLTLIAICRNSAPAIVHVPKMDPSTLPNSIGDFVGRDEPVDKNVLTVTQVDEMMNRVYRNGLGDSIVVHLGLWTQYDMSIPHKPDLCYPSAGWEIVGKRLVTVPVDEQDPITVKQFIFQRGTNRIAVVFWAQLADNVVTDSEGVRGLYQKARVTGEVFPYLVKTMLHTDARDLGQAEARLTRFVAALAPHVRRFVKAG
jgi:EpsI family protein